MSIETLDEKHWNIKQVAAHFGLSKQTAIRLVQNEPGVLKFKLGPKRARTMYSVPDSVLRRIYNRMAG